VTGSPAVSWRLPAAERAGATLASRVRTATPAHLALLAIVLYGAYALAAASLHGSQSFASVGAWVPQESTASATINAHLHANDRYGYDGEFFEAIALDPVNARYYMDKPAYRYGRIGYPMLARAVALGQARWIPLALILVNLLAVGAGTFFVAKLLARNGAPPLLAGLYFLYPGLFLAFMNDLSEPLAYCLAALGILILHDWRSPRRVLLAGAIFALAALTRETTLLIPATLAVIQVVRMVRHGSRPQLPVAFAAVAAVPYVAWISFVHSWLGSRGGGTPLLQTNPIPFSGLVNEVDPWQIFVLAIPVSLLFLALLTQLVRGSRTPTLLALGASLLALGAYLPPLTYQGYISSGRMQLGAVILALASINTLRSTMIGSRLTAAAAAFAYLPLVPILLLLATKGLAPVR
jgi:hypothetical protein